MSKRSFITTGKKVLASVVSAAMVIAFTPVVAMAESENPCVSPCNHEAKIGSTHYDTLQEALSVASGGTVTLLKDITVNGSGKDEPTGAINITNTVTLDGGKHTITAGTGFTGATGNHVINIEGGATVTVKNLTIDGTGESSSPKAHSGINVYTAASSPTRTSVSLNSVTILNCSTYGLTVGASDVTASSLKTSGNAWGGVNVDNNSGEQTSSLKLNSSYTNIAETPYSVVLENRANTSSTVSITYGTYKGAVGITNDINNGVSLSISGGVFEGPVGVGDNCGPNPRIAITGGTFSSDPSAFVPDNCLTQETSPGVFSVAAESSFVAEIVGGLKYTRLKTAFDAVPNDGESPTAINLLHDIKITSTDYIEMSDGKNVLLNLNGYNITGSSSTASYIFKVKHAKLHITGSGTLSTPRKSSGVVTPIQAYGSGADAENYTVVTVDEGVTLDSNGTGFFIDKDSAGSYKNYGLVVNIKGTVKAAKIGITINGSNEVTTGNVTKLNLDGATFTDASVPIYAAGYAKWDLKNCSISGVNSAIEIRAGEMTIDGGNYTASSAPTTVAPNGSGTTSSGAAIAIAQHTTKLPIALNITSGSFSGFSALYESNPQNNDAESISHVVPNVTGGTFNAINGGTVAVHSEDCTGFITGGTFSSKPADNYIASGYVAAPQQGKHDVVEGKAAYPISVVGPINSTSSYILESAEGSFLINGSATELSNPKSNPENINALAYWVYNGWMFTAKDGDTVVATYGPVKSIDAGLQEFLKANSSKTLYMDSKTVGYYDYPSSGGGTVTPTPTPEPSTPEVGDTTSGVELPSAPSESGSTSGTTTVDITVTDNTATTDSKGNKVDGSVSIDKIDSSASSVEIPETITTDKGTFLVTSIPAEAMKDNTTVESVTIPSSVTSIGESAFAGCTELTSVTVPSGVTEIKDSTFAGCTNLETVEVQGEVTSIAPSAFEDCTALTTINVPETVTTIGESAFAGCISLTSVSVPAGVATIEANTFANCTSLETVEVKGELTEIAADAFNGCTNLTSMTVAGTVKPMAIGTLAATGSLVIPESVTKVGDRAFRGTGITSVTIPAGVKMGSSVFRDCKQLKNAVVEKGVKTLSSYTFKGCSALKSVTVPYGVAKIERSAFSGCKNLTKVTLPKTVTSIGKYALYGAAKAKTLTVNSKKLTKSGVKGSLAGSKVTTVKVPKSMVSAYKKIFTKANCGKTVKVRAI